MIYSLSCLRVQLCLLPLIAYLLGLGLIRGYIQMEVLLVDAAERPEVRAECRASAFAGVAVDLAVAVPIIVPCPLVHAVADGGVGRRV
jgi:hypothetical protein